MAKAGKITLMISVLMFGVWCTGLIPLRLVEAAPGDLTVTITDGSLTATTVTRHLELRDDGVVVISRSFSESYTQSVGLTVEVQNSITRKMQEAIDAYRILAIEKARPAYINASSVIESNLDLTKEL